MATEFDDGCASVDCPVTDGILTRPHLRVQLSPPDQPWAMVRVCDLLCLVAFLEHEAQASTKRVFHREEWIDSHG